MLAVLLLASMPLTVAWAQNPAPRVSLETSMGVIVLELDAEKAPVTVANFLQYVRDGHYDGTIFHRVISSNPTVSARALYLKTLLLILGWIDVAIKSLMSTFDV